MARFFVDTVSAGRSLVDDEGVELADFEAARRETLALISIISKDEMPECEECEFSATLRDESGKPVYRATLTVKGEWLTQRGLTQLSTRSALRPSLSGLLGFMIRE